MDTDFIIDGLVQERRNSSALAMELCLSYTNPSIYYTDYINGHKSLYKCIIYEKEVGLTRWGLN